MASEFRKVLDDVAERRQGVRQHQPPAEGVLEALRCGDWPASTQDHQTASRQTVANAYRSEADDKQPMPRAPDLRLTLDDLRARARSGLTRQQAAALRRDFARQYHPDRTSAAERATANELMAQANAILDSACGDRNS